MRSRTIALFLIGGTATLFTAAATPAQTPTTAPQSTATTHPADKDKHHGPSMRPHPFQEDGEHGGGGMGRGMGRPPMGDHFGPPMGGRFEDREDEHVDAKKKSLKHDEEDDVEELTEQVRKLRRQIGELQDSVDEMSHQLKRQARDDDGHGRQSHRQGGND